MASHLHVVFLKAMIADVFLWVVSSSSWEDPWFQKRTSLPVEAKERHIQRQHGEKPWRCGRRVMGAKMLCQWLCQWTHIRSVAWTCFQEAACASTRLCRNEDLSHTSAEASLDNGAFYYLGAGLFEAGMGQYLSERCTEERPSTSLFLFHRGTNWKHPWPPVIWTIAGAFAGKRELLKFV